MKTPEKKSPTKNKKVEPTHVPEQNGDALMEAVLESAIVKQVLDVYRCHKRFFSLNNLAFNLQHYAILGQSCARIKGQRRRKCVEATSGDIVEVETTFDRSYWNSASCC